ncbi:MAG: hypothetical protein MZW92_39660 [Comamonadaceae bacterium]|nr:hypothetical protein [Comamonadaceae bacterium]
MFVAELQLELDLQQDPVADAMPTAVRAGQPLAWQRRTTAAQLAHVARMAGSAWRCVVFCWQRDDGRDHLAVRRRMRPTQAADIGRPHAAAALGSTWSGSGCRCGTRSTSLRLGTLLAIVARHAGGLACRRATPRPACCCVRPVALLLIVASALDQLDLIWALLLVPILGPRRTGRHLRHRAALDRLHRQAAVRGARGDRRPAQVEAIEATGASRAQVIGLCDGAAGGAGVRRDRGLPLGHQHPRIHRGRAGGSRRHRPAAGDRRLTPSRGRRSALILTVILATVVVAEWVSAKVRHAII